MMMMMMFIIIIIIIIISQLETCHLSWRSLFPSNSTQFIL